MEISKQDWKLFKDKVVVWQENYIDKLNKEYMELLTKEAAPSDKFWELEKRIKEDKKKPGVVLEIKKNDLISQLLSLLRDKVISMGDLEEFSSELKETIEFFMRRYG